MREIKLNNNRYLRGIINRAIVDESRLEFINGVALAEATIVKVGYGKENAYHCFGLIDENFQEVYSDDLRSDGERNLMFLKYNRKAERFSDNDYVVEVPCPDGENASWIEHRHVRVVDGTPTLINNIGGWPVRARKEGLVIAKTFYGWVLYDINNGVFITPYLVSIREAEDIDGLFDVTLKVALEDAINIYDLVDYLFLRIDSTGKIVSGVLSSLENGYLEVSPDLSIEELAKNRKQCLKKREVQFGKELSEFKKNIGTTTKGSTGHVIKMVDSNINNN